MRIRPNISNAFPPTHPAGQMAFFLFANRRQVLLFLILPSLTKPRLFRASDPAVPRRVRRRILVAPVCPSPPVAGWFAFQGVYAALGGKQAIEMLEPVAPSFASLQLSALSVRVASRVSTSV